MPVQGAPACRRNPLQCDRCMRHWPHCPGGGFWGIGGSEKGGRRNVAVTKRPHVVSIHPVTTWIALPVDLCGRTLQRSSERAGRGGQRFRTASRTGMGAVLPEERQRQLVACEPVFLLPAPRDFAPGRGASRMASRAVSPHVAGTSGLAMVRSDVSPAGIRPQQWTAASNDLHIFAARSNWRSWRQGQSHRSGVRRAGRVFP
jgi:hypothetical protein